MPTIAQRINVTVPQDLSVLITRRAKRNKVSMSKTVLDLVRDAIERDEDEYLARIADRRDATRAKLISHEEMWASL
jgi:metal-responsive CopG/Arc/MetJ family transcriptional regulator